MISEIRINLLMQCVFNKYWHYIIYINIYFLNNMIFLLLILFINS